IFDGRLYRLSPAESYWGAGRLSEEAAELEGFNLTAALARAPPPEFQKWFDRDISDYQQTRSQKARSTMLAFLQRLKSAHQRRQSDSAKQYRTLAKKIAAGQEPAPEEVLEILQESGKTVEGLEATAALIIRRQALAETVRKATAAEKQLPRVTKAIAAA